MALSLAPEPPSRSFAPSSTTGDLAESLHIRQAQLQDAPAIHSLIDSFSHDGTLLRRSYFEICQNIGTFTVVETRGHTFIGCASLHVYGNHLAEVRSIVVRPQDKGAGAGGLLVRALLRQAEAKDIRCLCLFTRIPEFFEHFHFHTAEHRALRDKVLKDCMHCARRNACDETAMILGQLSYSQTPRSTEPSHLHQSADLVQLQL